MASWLAGRVSSAAREGGAPRLAPLPIDRSAAGLSGPADLTRPGGRYSSTMKAVTIPNMPSSRSTWGRMWQCHTQVPGLSRWTSTV